MERQELTLNDRIALFITKVVSTMWCAYAFALLALVSLPSAIHGGVPTLIAWIAQTFLQLVLLSIIMVGQDIQTKHIKKSHQHHESHNKKLDKILNHLES
jgi:hypothetical protein